MGTPRVDVTDLQFQADPNFLPDKTPLWKTPESSDGWVHAHNAIRFEIASLKKVLEKLGDECLMAEWQVTAFKSWWAGHSEHIHEHHTNEDDIFNPALRARVQYPEKLVALMERIAEAVAALKVSSSVTALAALWSEYEEHMLPHLHEEEMVGLPLARAYFTPAEIDAITIQFIKKGSPISMGSFFHVMGSKKEVMAFGRENHIPFFVWHIPGKGFKALRTLYRRKMVSLI